MINSTALRVSANVLAKLTLDSEWPSRGSRDQREQFAFSREQLHQIRSKDPAGIGRRNSDLMERLALPFENGGMPSARKVRGVGSEQQTARAGHVQRPPEDLLQVD